MGAFAASLASKQEHSNSFQPFWSAKESRAQIEATRERQGLKTSGDWREAITMLTTYIPRPCYFAPFLFISPVLEKSEQCGHIIS